MEQSLLAHISHQIQNGEHKEKLDRTQSTSHHLGEIRDDYGDRRLHHGKNAITVDLPYFWRI
ncbi:MAG: hypothetical protein HWQ41_04590 [Nostoc sp. NOS(2021)]|uniref:hypothetical protein n=1 Tax=Nostoc sp. NOS(2021) TaxID=2815407 RepID=UPI0025E185FF|nr:hypothetical protein [Nostoc sp. NOS(2021)]MBN3894557.1 hypothetical protein [Nostoc sp. NOS(2021)]